VSGFSRTVSQYVVSGFLGSPKPRGGEGGSRTIGRSGRQDISLRDPSIGRPEKR
jgi:hypothetical protein